MECWNNGMAGKCWNNGMTGKRKKQGAKSRGQKMTLPELAEHAEKEMN